MRLTLLVPELIWPEPGDQLTLGKLTAPGFAWLAAHAAFTKRPRRPFETALANLFGLSDAPFGALRRLGETIAATPDDGHWLCADPVHLRFHHERIILADAGAFELSEPEAQAIVESLNAEFADVGTFYTATARRWYLRLNAAVDHDSKPISAIAGRRIDGELPANNSPLTRWLNEVQMFLHGHPVNERRQAAGHPAVNSLWLWGGGALPGSSNPPFATVWSDNPLATGLARSQGIPAHGLPDGLSKILAETRQTDEALIVLDSLLPPVLYENGEDWRTAWQALDRDWFAPLRSALGRQVDTLTIVAPTIYGQLNWSLLGKDRWKFWRKPQTLADIARELSEGSPS